MSDSDDLMQEAMEETAFKEQRETSAWWVVTRAQAAAKKERLRRHDVAVKHTTIFIDDWIESAHDMMSPIGQPLPFSMVVDEIRREEHGGTIEVLGYYTKDGDVTICYKQKPI